MQFSIDPESRKFTTFTCQNKQQHFVSCPYGLKHIPAHAQRVITSVLSGLEQ